MKGGKTGGRPANGGTASITICLQPELKEALKKAAKDDGRPVSELCALALRDFILEREAEKTLTFLLTFNKKAGIFCLHAAKEDAMADTAKKKMGRPANGATALMTISLTPELKDKLFMIARKDRRSASSLAAIILEQWVSEHAEEADNG